MTILRVVVAFWRWTTDEGNCAPIPRWAIAFYAFALLAALFVFVYLIYLITGGSPGMFIDSCK